MAGADGARPARGAGGMQQCGICSALAGLFRRVLCFGGGSRRGSGDSCYQELGSDEDVSVQSGQARLRCIFQPAEFLFFGGHFPEKGAMLWIFK